MKDEKLLEPDKFRVCWDKDDVALIDKLQLQNYFVFEQLEISYINYYTKKIIQQRVKIHPRFQLTMSMNDVYETYLMENKK